MTTPESKEKCCPKCYTEHPNFPNGCINPACHCHQRPESAWRKELHDERENINLYTTADIEAFIDRHIEAAYQRGFSDGFNDEGNSIYRSNLELQNTRLLENNRTLQAKLREGNRAILKEAIKLFENTRLDAHCSQHVPCIMCASLTLSDLGDRLRMMLSFQQEPQEL